MLLDNQEKPMKININVKLFYYRSIINKYIRTSKYLTLHMFKLTKLPSSTRPSWEIETDSFAIEYYMVDNYRVIL